MIVLDTNILIDIKNNVKETISKIKEIIEVDPYPAKITVFNKFEYLYGLIDKTEKTRNQQTKFINKFSLLQTTDKTPEILANIKHKYDKKGEPFQLADLLIACLVIENNLTLVTKDKSFERIKELKKIII